MKNHFLKIGIAVLTFIIGVTLGSVWVVRRYAKPLSTDTTSPIMPPTSKKGGLPCLVSPGDDVAKVKRLLASGIDVDSTDDQCIMMEPSPHNVTLLMQSAGRGDTEIVKLLLDNGANVNAKDGWEQTPLSYAVGGRHIEIIGLLLDRGADINSRAEIGSTPLMNAAGVGSLEVIEYLLDRGADINAQNYNGTTALMFAAGFKQPEAMNLLLERGAKPDLKDSHGRTASIYAKRGYPIEYRVYKE